MFPTNLIPENFLPVDAIPVDVVPSALAAFLLPLCEGIAVGLVVGAIVLLAMRGLERLSARWPEAEVSDAHPSDSRPSDAGQVGPRPAVVARRRQSPPQRAPQCPPARPAAQRSVLLARLS